jgi:hypothetical protein
MTLWVHRVNSMRRKSGGKLYPTMSRRRGTCSARHPNRMATLGCPPNRVLTGTGATGAAVDGPTHTVSGRAEAAVVNVLVDDCGAALCRATADGVGAGQECAALRVELSRSSILPGRPPRSRLRTSTKRRRGTPPNPRERCAPRGFTTRDGPEHATVRRTLAEGEFDIEFRPRSDRGSGERRSDWASPPAARPPDLDPRPSHPFPASRRLTSIPPQPPSSEATAGPFHVPPVAPAALMPRHDPSRPSDDPIQPLNHPPPRRRPTVCGADVRTLTPNTRRFQTRPHGRNGNGTPDAPRGANGCGRAAAGNPCGSGVSRR